MKRCPQCGREYPDTFGFCEQDATPLVAISSVSLLGPAPTVATRLPQRGRAMWLAVSLLLVGLVVGWQVLTHRPQAEGLPGPSSSASGGSLPLPSRSPEGNVSGASGDASTADPTPGEKLSASYSHAKASEWSVYSSTELGVQIEYPAGWTVQVTRYPERVRVQFTGGPDVSAGLDVSPSPYHSLKEWEEKHPGQWIWGDLEAGFIKRKGVHYHRERVGPYKLGDQIAMSWEFIVQPEGKPTMRKWDVGTICNRKGYALICEAPEGQFSEAYPKFDHMMTTMKFLEGTH